MSKVIGIDLGSTNSAVSVMEGGKPTAIANSEGERTTPSIIALKDGERKVGAAAKRQMVVNPKETVTIIKRFMGATYDESAEAIKHVQYDVVNREGKPRVSIEGREYSPEELSAMIVQKMKKTAEDYLGEEVKDAVITVPAFFSDAARQATKTAGELAGLNVLRVIAEPTAALLASNLDLKKEAKYLVVDEGGSTLDNSVADVSDGVVEILASNGDVYLGGTDFDKALADFVVETFKGTNNVDLSKDKQAMARIVEAAEKAKIELSSSNATEINLPYITADANGPQHLVQTITRAKFEQIITPFVDRIISHAKEAMRLADVQAKDLSGILLVGGSCRIPLIKERLKNEIGAELIESANLDLAVSEGACFQAAAIKGETNSDILLVDVTPLRYGIETLGGVMTTLIEANSTIPCKKSEIFSTAEDNQTAITVRVLQGNRPMAKDNKQIGIFNLDGILPAKKGTPQIEITFDCDVNGILTVTAVDKGTNKEQHITIEGGNTMTQEEIDKAKADAERFAEEDKKAKERADVLNEGHSIIYQQEKLLSDMADKLSDDDKKEVTDLVDKMKEAVKNEDIDTIKSLKEEINGKWNTLSEKIYKQQEQPQAEQPQAEQPSEDNVQDADFEEVK